MPALYNLACDGLLPTRFALVGVASEELTTEQFRERMTRGHPQFTTRKDFDAAVWDDLVGRLHYIPGSFDDDAAYGQLASAGRPARRRAQDRRQRPLLPRDAAALSSA